jgi:SAM-dependent methyltransferase
VSRYDDEIWRLVPEQRQPPAGRLASFVRGLGRRGRALDIGCGDGALTAQLDAEELVAADVSEVALSRARGRLPGARLVPLEPDGPLPFADSEFDIVLCAETLEHVRDVQLLLSEARRVLRPGGELAITTPAHARATGLLVLLRGFEHSFDPLSPHVRFFTARSLRRLLEELGFDVRSLRRSGGSLFALAAR